MALHGYCSSAYVKEWTLPSERYCHYYSNKELIAMTPNFCIFRYIKPVFFIGFFIVTLAATGQISQFPQVYNNNQGSSNASNLNIRQSASQSGSVITSLPIGGKIAAISQTTNSSDPNFYNWIKVSLPGTSGSAVNGYMPVTEFYACIDQNNNYATVTATSLNIREAAGASSANVKINSTNATWGQNSLVALTGNSQLVSGTRWYEMYLPNNCNKTKGWSSGEFLSLTSSSNYYIAAGRVCTSASECSYLGSINGANISFGSKGSTVSSGGSYQYKLSTSGSVTVTCSYTGYNSTTPPSYNYTPNSHKYDLHFVVGNTSSSCTTPSQAGGLSFSNVLSDKMDVSWSAGNGTGRIVVVKAGSAVSGTPTDGTNYTANTAFGSGAVLGSGEYVFYNSSGSGSVTLSNLSASTTYYFRVFEYGCSPLQYATGSATGNTASKATGAAGSGGSGGSGGSTAITPTANFSVSQNNIKPGVTVSFTDQSQNTPTSLQWKFDGGTPATSTSNNPSVTYPKSGTYGVKLTATNSAGSNSKEIKGYITVSPTGASQPLPTVKASIGVQTKQAKVLEPILVGSGSYEFTHTDVNIPVVHGSIGFTRYYNSTNSRENSNMGYGWTNSYSFSIDIQKDVVSQQDTIWRVLYPDGHEALFVPLYGGGGSSFPLYLGTKDSLHKNSGGDFTLFSSDNLQYQFNTVGILNGIVDLNGNRTSINYSGSIISSVTGEGGRSLNFTYTNGKITTIADPLSRTWVYGYDAAGNLETVKDAKNQTTRFSYDSVHQLTYIITPLGDTVLSNVYDAAGRVKLQKDAYGNATSISYDLPSMRDATITNPDNSTNSFHHDSLYRRIWQTDELGNSKKYSYDDNSNTATIINEKQALDSMGYDFSGNLVYHRDPRNNVTQIGFNNYHSPTLLTDPKGQVTTLTYDGSNNLVSMFLPDGGSRSFSITGGGLISSLTDGRGNVTNYTYSNHGDVLSVINTAGTSSYSYDAAGRLTEITDANRYRTTIRYDNNDNIISVRNALSHVDSFIYNSNDKLIAWKDRKGRTRNYEYDKKGRLVSIVNSIGEKTILEYDPRDNLVRTIDPGLRILRFTYDAKRRRVSVSNSSGTASFAYDALDNIIRVTDGSGISNQFTYTGSNNVLASNNSSGQSIGLDYDANENISLATDGLGRTTLYSFDPLNRIKQIKDAANTFTNVSYDLNGNAVQLTDPKGHSINFTYDASNRRSVATDASGNSRSYLYDPTGKLTNLTSAGGILNYTYDSIGRLTQMTTSSGGNNLYTYDSIGKLITMQNGSAISKMSYDSLDRLSQYTDPSGRQVSYRYDKSGNRTAIIYPGGLTVGYGYDSANNLISVTDWQNRLFSYSYDGAGRIIQVNYPNGTTCRYTYDPSGRLASRTNLRGGAVLSSSTYSYDGAGNRTAEQRSGPIASYLLPASRQYVYGNADELQGDSVWTYTNNGSGTRSTETKNSLSTTYTFSADEMLLSFRDSLTVLTNYSYNPLGQRLSSSSGTTTKNYLLDISQSLSQVLQITDGSGNIKSSFIYGLGLLEKIDSAGKPLFYHFDGQHNTSFLTDISGNVTDTFTYEPFGKMLFHGGPTRQPFCFLGEFGVEQETGTLYYIRARYYDAANGRFLSNDPYPYSVSMPQSLNRYVYSLNSPVSRFDKSGLYANLDGDEEFQKNFGQALDKYINNPAYSSFSAIIDALGLHLSSSTIKGGGDVLSGVADLAVVLSLKSIWVQYKTKEIDKLDFVTETWELLFPFLISKIGEGIGLEYGGAGGGIFGAYAGEMYAEATNAIGKGIYKGYEWLDSKFAQAGDYIGTKTTIGKKLRKWFTDWANK